jgi:hypothetical protein
MRKWLIVVAILVGWGITWLDSSLNWDDTGITALLIVISTGLLGFFSPNRPWLWALAVGIWIPLVGVFIRHNFGGVLALVVAFIGAYCGMFIRRISQNRPSPDA